MPTTFRTVYVASSWRNDFQPAVVAVLRAAAGEDRQSRVRARRSLLEVERDHCRAMHRLTVHDPSQAREAALWAQLAADIDAYLAPPPAMHVQDLFLAEDADLGPP
jgi:hypothetical protein